MVPMCCICWTSDDDDFYEDDPTQCIGCHLDGWDRVTPPLHHDEVLINVELAEGDY